MEKVAVYWSRATQTQTMVKAKVKATATATATAKATAQTKTDNKRSARNRELAQALEKSIEPTQNATRRKDDDQVQVALTE